MGITPSPPARFDTPRWRRTGSRTSGTTESRTPRISLPLGESACGRTADYICSLRGLPDLTHLGHGGQFLLRCTIYPSTQIVFLPRSSGSCTGHSSHISLADLGQLLFEINHRMGVIRLAHVNDTASTPSSSWSDIQCWRRSNDSRLQHDYWSGYVTDNCPASRPPLRNAL
jgi:hypothetical protein